MILVTQNGDEYEIRFPYDIAVVEGVKNVPGRVWHPEEKFWTIPAARLGFLIAQFKGTKYESEIAIKSDEDINVNASINEPNAIPDIDVSDVNWYVEDGKQVFNHQKDTVKFAKWRYENGLKSGFILADQPGCIDGSALIYYKTDLSGSSRITTLEHLYQLFCEGKHVYVKSFCEDHFEFLHALNIVDKGVKPVVQIVSGNKKLICTPDHRILTGDGWKEASQIEQKEVLYKLSNDQTEYCKVETVKELSEKHVYDIEINHPIHHNFIANDFIVHNCGKSLSVALWAMYMKEKLSAKHCLIISCVNSAKYNWREDIKKHTNGREVPYILGTRIKKDGTLNLSTGSKEKLADLTSLKMYGKDEDELPYFLVINIEAIRMRQGKKYPIADKIIELINKGKISIVVLDEVHLGTSPHSLQGKQLLRIKKESKQQIQWIPMTGTPIVSKPTDVFLPLRLVDGHTMSSYYSWCQKFCIFGGFGDHEIVGYKNIPMLKNMLQPNMLRRLKKDILDLPPKIHYTEYIENTEYQQKLYRKIQLDLVSERESIVKALNPMAKLLRLRQVNGSPELVDPAAALHSNSQPEMNKYLTMNAKLQRLMDLLDEILSEPTEKVVIFSNWVEPLRTLHRFISKKYKVCCYTGTMSSDDREKHKKAFIEDPERRVMIGTIGALGTSHTLTVARNVIFYDSPWNPSDIEQAEDRCHRAGTSDTVFVYSLITKDTVDEKVHEILSKKEGTANYIVDNELDLRNHPELFDLLLS